MRIKANTLIALGFVGAMALSVPSAARAQGFHFEGRESNSVSATRSTATVTAGPTTAGLTPTTGRMPTGAGDSGVIVGVTGTEKA
jgi:hypothetical protein